jgi:uncharacterized protein YegL
MTDPNKTAVAFIIDESGSMNGRRADVIGGFNSFIEAQKKEPGQCTVSVTTFADQAIVDYTDKPLSEVGPLDFSPNGWTALYDAVGKTITELGARLRAMPEEQRPSRVIVVIITDGGENSSKEFKKAHIREMLKHQTEKYNWVFNFLGCGLEAMEGADAMGISATNATQFSSQNASAVFANTSEKVSHYRGMDASIGAASMAYSAEERKSLMADPTP